MKKKKYFLEQERYNPNKKKKFSVDKKEIR